MKRNLIVILCSAFLLGAGIVGSVQAQSSRAAATSQTVQLSYSEKYDVCCHLATKRILSLNAALFYLRNGRLEIGKVATGHYWAKLNGGPMISILIDDNI